MHNLICMMLSLPDMLLESDPVSDIIQLWKNHGIQNVIVLNGVSVQSMSKIYTEMLTLHETVGNGIADDTILFDIPESIGRDEGYQSTHRMVMAIVDSSLEDVEALLDETEEITKTMVNSQQNLLFVMPMLHVRGFAGLSK